MAHEEEMHPVLFHIGSFEVGTYALFALLGLAALVGLFSHLAAREGESRIDFVEIALWAFIVGLVASKLFGAATQFNPEHPRESVYHVLRFGGTYYVGFLAGAGFLALMLRRRKVAFATGLDWLAPSLALGHAIGRIGCFLAGCCWGAPCSLAWAVTFTSPDAHRLTGVPLGVPLHPTQLYESGAEFLIALLLLWKHLRWPWRRGSTFLLYVALYGLVRFGIEFVRDDPRGTLSGYPTSQPLALASSLIALALLGVLARRGRPVERHAQPAAPPMPEELAPTPARSGGRRRKR
jgi:phosphatidylglycerol:prolipoprotein diacylglycerol transferase